MSEELRPWQRPLDQEAIQWLQEQFAIHKARIENVWGPPVRENKPWVRQWWTQ